MRLPRAWSILAAVAIVIVGSYAVALITGGRSSREVAPTAVGVVPAPGSVAAAEARTLAEVDRLIGVFEERIEEYPDALNLQFLGQLYLRKASLTGDVDTYSTAADRLTRALEQWPDSLDGLTMLGTARNALHDFTGAAEAASQVVGVDGDRLDALALLGDARLALGDLEGAEEAFERLEDGLPGHPAVLVRLSRLYYLRSDAEGAVALAEDAVAAAGGLADLPWYHAYAGQLAFDLGDHETAVDHFERALEVSPALTVAQEGLARTLTALDRIDEAIELYQQATAAGPDPHLHALLGDLYLIQGDPQAAEEQYLVVESIGARYVPTSDAYDRDIALFHADRERDLAEALRLAEGDLGVRQDPYAYDTYAWALYRNGRFDEARTASDEALMLGTPDAGFWYHAGLISLALGDEDRAAGELGRALEINPGFDPLLAGHALATLEQLRD